MRTDTTNVTFQLSISAGPNQTNQMINIYSNEFQLKQFHCKILFPSRIEFILFNHLHTLAQSYRVCVDDCEESGDRHCAYARTTVDHI